VIEDLPRKAAAEAIGASILVFGIVGSGIAVERLSSDGAVRLFVNAAVTGASLAAAIWISASVSGAHLNPAVTVAALARRAISAAAAVTYIVAQMAGAIAGGVVANLVFGISLLGPSTHHRAAARTDLSEFLVTAMLVLVVIATEGRPAAPVAIGVFIAAAIVASPSTAFANPAVTVARMLSDSYTGIAPGSVGPFIASQLAGGVAGALVGSRLFAARERYPVR
jgi:glycerol uptake facilitator-like aquaporin